MAAQTFYWGGRWWKPSDRAAFAKYLQAHGASFAGWAKNHPHVAQTVFGAAGAGGAAAGQAGPAPMSLTDWAGKQYDESVAPELTALDTERARTKAESEQQMKNIQGIYAALAGMLKDVGPAVSANYQAAAGTELAAGRGLGNQEAARGKAEGDKAAGYLAAAGAPQAAIEGAKAAAGGDASGNLVYGTGGMIPATTTSREGAAFASAADMLPAGAVGQGQMHLRSALADAMKNDAGFGDKIAEIRAGRAAGVQKIVSDFLDQQRQERALRDQERALGIRDRTATARITGVDPVTGKPTYDATYDANKVKADAAKARQSQRSKDKTAHASAIKAREDAFASARHSMATDAKSFAGHPLTLKEQVQWSVKNGKPVSQAPKTGGGVSYAQAKKRLFAKYSDLLRYASGAGRATLKKRLNAMIDEVLSSYGMRPSAPAGVARGASAVGDWAQAQVPG